jgi:hypothetical protein
VVLVRRASPISFDEPAFFAGALSIPSGTSLDRAKPLSKAASKERQKRASPKKIS